MKTSSVAVLTKTWCKASALVSKFKDDVSSTNDWAKQEALQVEDDAVLYLTEHQTAGRGRGSNKWTDRGQGKYLLSSWSLAAKSPPQPITTPLVGLALYNACSEVWHQHPWSLKAPNDIYLDGKKVGGLLIETVAQGKKFRLIVGLGINVYDHPPEQSSASHLGLYLEPGEDLRWEKFLQHWWDELSLMRKEFTASELSDRRCRQILAALNANPKLKEKYVGLEPDGSLRSASRTQNWINL